MERSLLRPAGWLLLPAMAAGLLAGCGQDEADDDQIQPVRAEEVAPILPALEAITGADVSTLDPATMNDAEITKALGAELRCLFRYTGFGEPVLAVNRQPAGTIGDGVVKVNGNLIVLAGAMAEDGAGLGMVLARDPIRIAVSPDRDGEAWAQDDMLRQEAVMVFGIGQSLEVGYRGYLDCAT